MDEARMDGRTRARDSSAADTSGAEAREQLQGALESAANKHGRAAVIVVEVDSNYAKRAHERVQALLADRPRRGCEWVYSSSLGRNRFALVIAPIGYPAHVRALAEELTRSLDPRICPLLRRALPYARFGVGMYPDDDVDARLLISRAEQVLERSRTASGRRERPPARRRCLDANRLRPQGAG
jgi:hypothetical protein